MHISLESYVEIISRCGPAPKFITAHKSLHCIHIPNHLLVVAVALFADSFIPQDFCFLMHHFLTAQFPLATHTEQHSPGNLNGNLGLVGQCLDRRINGAADGHKIKWQSVLREDGIFTRRSRSYEQLLY